MVTSHIHTMYHTSHSISSHTCRITCPTTHAQVYAPSSFQNAAGSLPSRILTKSTVCEGESAPGFSCRKQCACWSASRAWASTARPTHTYTAVGRTSSTNVPSETSSERAVGTPEKPVSVMRKSAGAGADTDVDTGAG
jgi:hypothetical protein